MITQELEIHAQERGGKIALQLRGEDGTEQLTYSDLWGRVCSAAACLSVSGISKGDRVVLCAENSLEWIIAYLGIHFSGAVVVPIDAQYGISELNNLLEFSRPKAMILDEARIDQASLRDKSLVWAVRELCRLSTTPESSGLDKEFEPYVHDPEDVMSIVFSSGTTGNPKGIQLTCGNINSNIHGIVKGICISPSDNILNILPLHHTYSNTCALLAPLMVGATVTLSLSLKGSDIVETMQKTGVTILPGVPQLFTLFDRAIFQKVEGLGMVGKSLFWILYALSRRVRIATGIRIGKLFFKKIHRRFGKRFRMCVSGGAKLDRQVSERFLNLGILILEGYGLTETSPVISFTPVSKPRPGSVGWPLEEVEVRIDRPDRTGVGEICVRGPNVMKGYFQNPQATEEVLREGWFHTGDLGYIDSDSMIRITGRAKEVIVLPSGKNIYPEEVEGHYENTPLVKEVCIQPIASNDGMVVGLRAIVVPDAEEMAARKVVQPRMRVRDELAKKAGTLPSYLRIGDLVLYEGPFPRTRLGKLRRSMIADHVSLKRSSVSVSGDPEISYEQKTMMTHPSVERFLGRFEEVTDIRGPFTPSQDLEIDLGLDSLTQVQVSALLEQEFGVVIPDDQAASVRTIGDLLDRILSGEDQALEESDGRKGRLRREDAYDWQRRLSEPSRRPLDVQFNIRRGIFGRLSVLVVKVFALALALFAHQTRLVGRERLPGTGPFLICPNHQSYIDPLLIYALFPTHVVQRIFFVGFAEFFRKPPLSWLIRFGRVILTGGAGMIEESLRLSYQGLVKGMVVCTFPEGGLSTTGEVGKPSIGAGILSVEAGVPIVPVLIQGAVNSLSNLRPGFRFCKIRIVVGSPLWPPAHREGTETHTYQEMVDRWYRAIRTMKGEKERR